MSSINKASDDLKKLGKYLAGLIEFTSSMDKMGAFEDALLDLEKRLDLARKSETLLNEKIDKLKKEASDQALENKNKMDSATHEANNIIKLAGIKAADLIAEGGDQAQDLLDAANLKLSEINAAIEKAKESKALFEKDAAEQKRKLDLINVELDKIKGKL